MKAHNSMFIIIFFNKKVLVDTRDIVIMIQRLEKIIESRFSLEMLGDGKRKEDEIVEARKKLKNLTEWNETKRNELNMSYKNKTIRGIERLLLLWRQRIFIHHPLFVSQNESIIIKKEGY